MTVNTLLHHSNSMKSSFPFELSLSKPIHPFDKLRANGSYAIESIQLNNV